MVAKHITYGTALSELQMCHDSLEEVMCDLVGVFNRSYIESNDVCLLVELSQTSHYANVVARSFKGSTLTDESMEH